MSKTLDQLNAITTATDDDIILTRQSGVDKTLSVLKLKSKMLDLIGTSSTTFAAGDHGHSGVYEPVITKATGFNLATGTTSGTVATGDHAHSGVYEPVISTKNGAFNVDFGTTHTTTAYGDHSHTLLNAGSVSSGFIGYNGTTQVAGEFDGGSTAPSSTSSTLNFNGIFAATKISSEYFISPSSQLNVTGGTIIVSSSGGGHIYLDSGAGKIYLTGAIQASSSLKVAGDLTVAKILPNMTGATGSISIIDVGDSTHRFANVWANEVHVGATSLYVNGKQVISDNSSIMTFTTDVDQGVTLKTTSSVNGTGNGNLQLASDNQIGLTAKGGIDFTVPSTVASKNITLTNSSASGQILLNAGTVGVTGKLSVTGDFEVTGTTTTVNTTDVNIKDNLIVINSSLVSGTPPSNLIGGISVLRGDSTAYRFIFQESNDTFRIGESGSEQAVATREDSPVADGVVTWNDTLKKFVTATKATGFNLATGTTAGTVATGDHTHSIYAPLASPTFTGTISGGGLGTAAFTASTTYATSAQGTLATNALPAASYTASDVVSKVTSANPATQGRFVICGQGTSFPSTPGFADEYYRTDLDEWYKYNGATWLQI